jgi:photosystem II stability/assembly factor-like uncharacterized protein
VWTMSRVVVLVAVSLLLLGCAAEQDTILPVISLDEDPGLAHVHGLGVNPSDGKLYVATHFGLWRVEDDGDAERVGDHYLDLMGFAVAGPDRFLASGHPPLTDELPPHLGLIESTDAGVTWRSVSQLGGRDFHALRTAHDRIYAWDTIESAFLVSDDGLEWDERSREAIFDFVVDPDDADHVLATVMVAPGDLRTVRSRDGGRTWSTLDAPTLARLEWEDTDRMLAVGPDGAVWLGGDAGDSWERVGDVGGFPEALLDAGEALYVAADGRLQTSTDAGRTWDDLLHYH